MELRYIVNICGDNEFNRLAIEYKRAKEELSAYLHKESLQCKTAPPVATKPCPLCKKPDVRMGSSFCPNCGTRLIHSHDYPVK